MSSPRDSRASPLAELGLAKDSTTREALSSTTLWRFAEPSDFHSWYSNVFAGIPQPFMEECGHGGIRRHGIPLPLQAGTSGPLLAPTSGQDHDCHQGRR
eukprot:1949913-Heterocapsa_arctica.AAC.1